MPKLNKWSITPIHTFDPYQPPECTRLGLHGIVTGHPKFDEGDEVTTSEIRALTVDEDKNELHVTTSTGTVYLLGDVDPRYEAMYPNARQRLIESWTRNRMMKEITK